MSRFLETLREVSRSQVVPAEIPHPGKPEAAAAGGLNNFPLVDLPTLGDPIIPVTASAKAMPAEASPSETPSQEHVDAKSVEMRVDLRTPLMPHTMDSSIVEQYRKLRTKI